MGLKIRSETWTEGSGKLGFVVAEANLVNVAWRNVFFVWVWGLKRSFFPTGPNRG